MLIVSFLHSDKKPPLRVKVMKESRENRSKKITIKLTHSEFERFKESLKVSGLTESSYFRQLLVGKDDVEVSKGEEVPLVDRKLVFLFNKISNNINQLAKNSNRAHLTGLINTTHYKLLLNRLINIEDLLNNMIKNSK